MMTGMIASAALMVIIVVLTRNGLLSLRWPWYACVGTFFCIGVARIPGYRGKAG